MCFFYLCVISVNYLRANIFFIKTTPQIEDIVDDQTEDIVVEKPVYTKKYNTSKKAFVEFLSLSKTRWVGIDALVAVQAFKGKSFNFFKQSFNDKFDKNEFPFYEKNVQQRTKAPKHVPTTTLAKKTIQYGITTPGILAFLYYTGSNIFVFFIIFLISILILTFEKFIFIIFNNPILCSILSQVLAYRLIHFGYMPQNTYMLLTSILLTIIGLFLIKKLLNNKT